MTRTSRRQTILGGLAVALLGRSARSLGFGDAPRRSGAPLIKAGIAAYSFRDRLTGKAQPTMDLADFIRDAAITGWDGVELTSYYFPRNVTTKYLANLKRLCYLNAIHITSSSVGNVFTHPAGPARDREIDKVRVGLRHAATLGASGLRVFAGDPQSEQSTESAERCCIECLSECVPTAAETGVMLALENHGGIVAESSALLRIIKAVDSPWLGANLDTGNFRTDDPYADIAAVAPYAITTHLKSEVVTRSGVHSPTDIQRIVRILTDHGYRGYLILEYEGKKPVEIEAPRILAAIRSAVAALS